MSRKVTWKKGMRLSTELFDASDRTRDDALRQLAIIASNGRMGLYPASTPFQVSINISDHLLEIISLSCHGVTRNGSVVDIDFDSNYTNSVDTRVGIPACGENQALLLVIRMTDGEYTPCTDMLSQTKYSFMLLDENMPLTDDMLPIAMLVNQYGWRINDADFVPPCLTVAAHQKYKELYARALSLFKTTLAKCEDGSATSAKLFMSQVWTSAISSYVRLDKESYTLSPEALFSILQQFVATFLINCLIGPPELVEKDAFVMYSQRPLDMRQLYRDIEDGLNLINEINLKVDLIGKMVEEPAPTPSEPPRPPKPNKPRKELTEEEKRKLLWGGYKI